MDNPAISFNRAPVQPYAEVQWLTPRVRRIVACNPSPFTFTGTNTYIIGLGNVVVLDPGPHSDEHFAVLHSALNGETVTAIALTHRHRDHCDLAPRLAEAFTAPIAAFPLPPTIGNPSTTFDAQLKVDIPLHHGDRIGPLTVIHTPGHTPDHLCFAAEDDGILFSGDHIMGWSTSVVAPPLGNMGAYLNSLDIILNRTESTIFPGHGGHIQNPKRFVSALAGHRKLRGVKIVELVGSGQYSDLESLSRALYGDISPELFPAAMATTAAHIEHLKDTVEGFAF